MPGGKSGQLGPSPDAAPAPGGPPGPAGAPLHPLLDREPVAAQDGSGSEGDRGADARLCPGEAGSPESQDAAAWGRVMRAGVHVTYGPEMGPGLWQLLFDVENGGMERLTTDIDLE